MQFWLDRGVDGLRLDAVPYLIEREGTICENLDETHEVLQEDPRARSTPAIPIACCSPKPTSGRPTCGRTSATATSATWRSTSRSCRACSWRVRQEDRHPIVEILRQTPEIPDNCQWAMFLRNHDELTLEMVTDEERDYMYQAYAADPQMRINVGIRRRLAPLLENSRRRIELLHGLLFSMPGTPVIYYGDEIGMGDNIYLGDRNGVRTPMQWTGDRNGGFSRADPARLYAPPIMDPVYGYQAINVEAQERAPFSLLNWMKRMIGLRKQSTGLRPRHDRVPARAEPQGARVRAPLRGRHGPLRRQPVAHRCSRSSSICPRFKGMTPVEMLGLTEFPRIGELPYFLTLRAVLRSTGSACSRRPPPITARVAPETAPTCRDAPALFMGAAWDTLLDGNVRTLIERDLLLPFLQRQRWFGGKARPTRAARFVDWGVLRRGAAAALRHHRRGRIRGRRAAISYFLPLAICASRRRRAASRSGRRTPSLARVTGARKGVLFDAWLDDRFARALLEALERAGADRHQARHASARVQTGGVRRRCAAHGRPTRRRAALGGEQSNTSIVYGDRLILKLFRRLAAGHQSRLRDRPAADRATPGSRASRRRRRARVPRG